MGEVGIWEMEEDGWRAEKGNWLVCEINEKKI